MFSMNTDPLHQIEQITKKTNSYMGKATKNSFNKYPITFSMLVLFGIVSVMHGFESIIEIIPFLNQHPIYVFFIGIIILVLTGTLYKRLNKKLD